MAGTQPTIQFNVEADVRAATEMAAALTPYIYQDDLYGTLPGSLPRLTVGGLIMRLHRLTAIRDQLTPAQQQAVTQAQTQFDQVRKEWTVAYEGKLERELTSRLQAYGQMIKEVGEVPRLTGDSYSSEIEKRVIIEGLRSEAEGHNVLSASLASQIQNLDTMLRRYIQTADFVWDKRLEAAYPRDPYWYLYATVKK